MPNAKPHSRRRIKPLTALVALLAFAVASVSGGLVLGAMMVPATGAIGAITHAGTDMFEELPEDLAMPPLSEPSTLLAADGFVLAKFFYQNRRVVPLAEISVIMQKAIVSLEDRRFYSHSGIDPQGLARALISNSAGGETQGASTLTQQFVKNYMVEAGIAANDPVAQAAATGQTLARKIREAKLALALERRMSKDEILQGYLNIAQFGRSVYGIEAASQYYFSKSAKDLNLAEASLLAGIPQSPNNWDPTINPEGAATRRTAVLDALLRDDVISQEQYDEVQAMPVDSYLNITPLSSGCSSAGSAAYFCQYVEAEILSNPAYGATQAERDALLKRGGLTITTTLDRPTHDAAVRTVNATIPQGDGSGHKIAISAIEPGTGKILALAQNTRFGNEDGNMYVTEVSYNVDKAHGGGQGFQPGSTMKVFTLAEWLRQGKSVWTQVGRRSTTYTDSDFAGHCGEGIYFGSWTVSEVEGKRTNGTVMASLADSINNSFVDMASQMDLCNVLKLANDVGLHSPSGGQIDSNPSEIIGATVQTPLSMANAYATFAAHGTYCSPVAILKIVDRDGKELEVPGANCHQVLEAKVADQVTTALFKSVNSPSYAGVVNISGRQTAGKTGTTDNNVDTWFVGYSPGIAASTWVGHSEAQVPGWDVTINGTYYSYLYGSTVAAPAWRDFMADALANKPYDEFTFGYLGEPPRPTPSPSPSPSPRGSQGAVAPTGTESGVRPAPAPSAPSDGEADEREDES
ncbi:transglycosylase domain-containing protein [Buchananella felis]|uniref:transglycosylase domain-containing protein n=1 Tax=Buchananella felis TaxID=3231492 RepID=UPI003529544B